MRADLINAENIAEAVRKSRESPLGRAIVPLTSGGKPLMGANSKNQYFLNAFQPGTEVDTHSHQEKLESFFLLQGKLKVILFSAEGEVEEIMILENKGDSSFVTKGRFHTVVALEPDTVVYEYKEDRYDAVTDKISAPWVPPENKLNDPELAEKRADFYGRWLVKCKVGDRVELFKKLEEAKTPNTLTNEETSQKAYDSQEVPGKTANIPRVVPQNNPLAEDDESVKLSPAPNDSSIIKRPTTENETEPSCVSDAFARLLPLITFNIFCMNQRASSPAPKEDASLVTQKIGHNTGVVINNFFICTEAQKQRDAAKLETETIYGVSPQLFAQLNY
jgi:cupin fold WbuC family metalloprotein